MTDIAATGALYTWNNKQESATRIYSRLDRFRINQEWMNCFLDMIAHFYPEVIFDHCPCVVSNFKTGTPQHSSFKYFNMWGLAPTFLDRVKEEWERSYEGHKLFGIVKKLKGLKHVLKGLNSECYSDIENRTVMAVQSLDKLQQHLAQDPNNSELVEHFLKQKAKIHWTEEGDQNTALFHGAIKKRYMANKVIQIEDQHGKLCQDSQSIQAAFLDYYMNLLGSTKETENVRLDILNKGNLCTQEHWSILNMPVTNEEIKQVFFATPIDKSPGPDEYTSSFFKDAWEIVGIDICSAIKYFFTTGKLLNQLNAINITLIPKCERPTSVKQFRPIACCNMIYKGAFIRGRAILENVLICQDIVKMYNRKSASPRGLFKIDLQKAYDSVESGILWSKYDLLMFCKGTTQSIMLLVTAFSTFSKTSGLIMNNGKPEVFFNGMATELKDDIRQVTRFMEGQMAFSVIRRIEAVCRNFFWDGCTEYHRVPLVKWDTITLPKNEGGLGVKNAAIWNIATMAKLVDWLYCKAGRLWIKWVNQIYIKHQSWHDYKPAADVTWTWKNICKVKEIMKPAYSEGKWMPDARGYIVSRGYDWLRPHQTKPVWFETVWCNWNIPKHSLISWLIRNNGINTREKLFRIGCCNSDSCSICDAAPETREHLFFKCGYSKLILSKIKDWCKLQISSTGDVRYAGLKVQKNVYALVLAASYYHVWTQRNNARMNAILDNPKRVVQFIKDNVKHRIKFKRNDHMSSAEKNWLLSLEI
ncbi:uncharacterized protein LOC141640043 [Silene latifolia]|uniref:uncharacterized protein LOC141640043 n=1 Tax=Silene latifolia TaxID=37657 RepID=UPI003D771671